MRRDYRRLIVIMRNTIIAAFLVLGFIGATARSARAQGLTYYVMPVPCRVMDTRMMFSSPIPHGSVLNILIRGAGVAWVPQGGQSGCGLPTNAIAVIASFSSINPDRPGHATVWAYNHQPPSIATALVTTGASVDNQLTVELCAVPNCAYDISMYTSYGAHFTVDLIGYYLQ